MRPCDDRPYEVERVEALGQRGPLQPLARVADRHLGHARRARARGVARDARGHVCLEHVAHHAEPGRSRRRDVDGALGGGGVGVVDHEALLVAEAPG